MFDSAQYFAGSSFKNWKIDFNRKSENSVWRVRGELESGAECALEFVPDGKEFVEFLTFETETATWEFFFPNTPVAVPEGEIIVWPRDGSPATVTRGDKAMPVYEATGFRGGLLDFFERLETGDNPAHRPDGVPRHDPQLVEEMTALTTE